MEKEISQNKIKIGSVVFVQIITMLVAVIAMLIDGIMTGIFLGKEALAAYGLTNPVTMIVVAIGGLIASGIQILGGRCAGKNDEEGLNKLLTTSLVAGLTVGIVMGVVVFAFANPLSYLLGAKDEVVASLTSDYLKGIAISMPALAIMQITPSFLQMKHYRNYILVAALSQIVIDVLFDYLNVKVFFGGLWGMAMATVASCYVSVILIIVPLFLKAKYRFSFKYFKFQLLGSICAYGLLYLIYKASVALMSLFLNRALSDRGGVDFLAANSIIFSLELIVGAIPSGFGSATSLLIGMEKESHGMEAVKKCCQKLVILSIIVNVIQILIFGSLAKPLIYMFSPESESVISISSFGLRLYILAVLPNTINYIMRNYHQNLGNTKSAYIICLLNHLVLPLVAGLILMYTAPISYIWLCFVIGHMICLIVTYLLTRFYNKKSLEVASI